MGPRPHLSFCAWKTAWLAPELLVSMGPCPHLWFCMQNSDFWTRITSLYVPQTSPVVLCMQNRAICTRNTSLCGIQTSPVVLCMQNSMPSIRITSLYASQTSSAVLCIQKPTLGPELYVSMGPSNHLWFMHAKQRFWTRIQVSIGTRPHLSLCACTTAWLAPEILVSMGSSPHLWFLHEKQWVLDQNYKCPWVPTSPVVLCVQYSVISPRITCLYGSQPSPAVCKKPQMRAGTHMDLSFWCKSRSFARTKRQVRSGTQRDMQFWS